MIASSCRSVTNPGITVKRQQQHIMDNMNSVLGVSPSRDLFDFPKTEMEAVNIDSTVGINDFDLPDIDLNNFSPDIFDNIDLVDCLNMEEEGSNTAVTTTEPMPQLLTDDDLTNTVSSSSSPTSMMSSTSSIFEDTEMDDTDLASLQSRLSNTTYDDPPVEEEPANNGASADDNIKSDFMWSSSLKFLENKSRKRDVSMTLSECAESLFRDIKDIDSVFGEDQKKNYNTSLIQDNEQSLLEISEDAIEVSDEEIDVVSDCSSSTISTFSTGSMSSTVRSNSPTTSTTPQARTSLLISSSANSSRPTVVQAGRSLLRNSRINKPQEQKQDNQGHHPRYQAEPSRQTIIDHMYGDHCYFAVRQDDPVKRSRGSPSAGLLTPNESSDDEDVPSMTANSRKRQREPEKGEPNKPVKFKFRMRFNSSSSPQRQQQTEVKSNSKKVRQNSNNLNRQNAKRKSAIKNPHCPSPVKAQPVVASASATPTVTRVQTPSTTNRRHHHQCTADSSKASVCSQDQKCREIRDLHNSMERQRRVDLRNNFEQLKVVVPELRDMEKASKLNILNKSAEYCRNITALEQKLIREKERESARQHLLKKKLNQLMASCISSSSTVRVARHF